MMVKKVREMKRFFDRTSQLISKTVKKQIEESVETLINLGDPVVGARLIEGQQNRLLFRVDGRETHEFSQEEGLKARVPFEQVKKIRLSQVESYQQYNTQPFGYGVCTNVKDSISFLDANGYKRHIHVMVGPAASLLNLKVDAGIETSQYDQENEYMVLQSIRFSQFLVSIHHQYTDKLKQGSLVPNGMHEFNTSLPKTLRLTDLKDVKSMLIWLLQNNAEREFNSVCQELFENSSEEQLSQLFGKEKFLQQLVIKATKVFHALKQEKNEDQEEVSSLLKL